MKNFLITLFAITALFTSCKKDENQRPQNYITFDGKTTELTYASAYEHEEGLEVNIIADRNSWQTNHIRITFPKEIIGKLAQLHKNHNYYSEDTEDGWDLNGYFFETPYNYHYFRSNRGKYHDHQWVKIVKNAGENNYTIEFAIRFDEKLLIGTFTGPLDTEQN